MFTDSDGLLLLVKSFFTILCQAFPARQCNPPPCPAVKSSGVGIYKPNEQEKEVSTNVQGFDQQAVSL